MPALNQVFYILMLWHCETKKEKTEQIWFVFLMDTCKGYERLCYKRTERNEIVVNGAVFE